MDQNTQKCTCAHLRLDAEHRPGLPCCRPQRNLKHRLSDVQSRSFWKKLQFVLKPEQTQQKKTRAEGLRGDAIPSDQRDSSLTKLSGLLVENS